MRILQSRLFSSISRIKIKKLYQIPPDHHSPSIVRVNGWIRSIRNQKKFTFLQVYDGSCLDSLQIIISKENNPDAEIIMDEKRIQMLTTGTSVDITGTVVPSTGGKQAIELIAKTVKIIGECPADSYPLQKKRHSLEFLRTIGHLRPRTNTFGAITRVSSCLAAATHQFFQNEGFLHVHTPIITSSDCEGAGEMFQVKASFPIDKNSPDQSSTSREFFGKPTFLTVSGQLSAEAFACSVGDVYTFGPTFRAENSNTTRHLAEFHMVEPELAFANLDDAMTNAENYIKFIVKATLEKCNDDLDFFSSHYDSTLLQRLQRLLDEPFVRIPYKEAIILLQKEIQKDPTNWKYPDVQFGTDLATEHERWLAEKYFNSCVFVYNYPKEIKAFYMRNNDDNQTVASFDLLVPGMGELIGGSQREERYEILLQKIQDAKLNPADYSWYLDTRRFGTIPHAGYGLGFERLICLITSMENIRDAIPFPRYPGTADY